MVWNMDMCGTPRKMIACKMSMNACARLSKSLFELGYRQAINPSLDGNTVEMVVEQTEFSENAIRYQTSLTFLNGRISGLMSAIRGE